MRRWKSGSEWNQTDFNFVFFNNVVCKLTAGCFDRRANNAERNARRCVKIAHVGACRNKNVKHFYVNFFSLTQIKLSPPVRSPSIRHAKFTFTRRPCSIFLIFASPVHCRNLRCSSAKILNGISPELNRCRISPQPLLVIRWPPTTTQFMFSNSAVNEKMMEE